MKQKETIETQSEFVQFKCTPTLKAYLQSLADKDNRKLADYIRLQLSKLIK